MSLEVEQKYPVANLADVQAKLIDRGALIADPIKQVDTYYAHPARDFSQTDEAVRIRRIGDQNLITYKGPKLASTAKTRREIELPLGSGQPNGERWHEFLEALGFQAVREVSKRRQTAKIDCGGKTLEIALDEVESLGSFVEIEVIVEPEELKLAEKLLAETAESLGLSNSERRSYLEMLLDQETA
jgi:adenylate cyclase class 2